MGKLQHYVPRFYLRAWAQKEKIYCLQNNEIRNPNIKNVGAENYFYRLQKLRDSDLDFLRGTLIEGSTETLKSSYEELIHAFTLPHITKQMLEDLGHGTSKKMKIIDQMIIELNETMHTSIEEDFRPHLAAMISGDLGFLKDKREAAVFYKGLATQCVRTNHIKRSRLVMPPDRFKLYMRIANLLTHILATKIGLNLYADRNKHKIILLHNTTAIPFITSDQPIINIAGTPKDTDPPEKFELYYPLSPTRAMFLLESFPDLTNTDVSTTFVDIYNLRIAADSYRQVFSNSPRTLERIRVELPAYLSCF